MTLDRSFITQSGCSKGNGSRFYNPRPPHTEDNQTPFQVLQEYELGPALGPASDAARRAFNPPHITVQTYLACQRLFEQHGGHADECRTAHLIEFFPLREV